MVQNTVLLGDVVHLGSGPYEAHLAPKHVQELRDFVDTGAPEETAQPRVTRVIGALVRLASVVPVEPNRPSSAIVLHRAELVHLKRPAIASHAVLSQHNIGSEGQSKSDPGEGCDGRQHDERGSGEENIN
jgi:hypothetical protein